MVLFWHQGLKLSFVFIKIFFLGIGYQILIDVKVIYLFFCFVCVVQEVEPRTIISGMSLPTLSWVPSQFYRPLLRGQNQIFPFVIFHKKGCRSKSWKSDVSSGIPFCATESPVINFIKMQSPVTVVPTPTANLEWLRFSCSRKHWRKNLKKFCNYIVLRAS